MPERLNSGGELVLAAIGFAPPLDRAFQRIERRGQPARRDFDLARPGGGIG